MSGRWTGVSDLEPGDQRWAAGVDASSLSGWLRPQTPAQAWQTDRVRTLCFRHQPKKGLKNEREDLWVVESICFHSKIFCNYEAKLLFQYLTGGITVVIVKVMTSRHTLRFSSTVLTDTSISLNRDITHEVIWQTATVNVSLLKSFCDYSSWFGTLWSHFSLQSALEIQHEPWTLTHCVWGVNRPKSVENVNLCVWFFCGVKWA